jgi:DNA modification methylase
MAVKDQIVTPEYALYNGDCVEVMKGLKANSVHLSVYSPPFAGLYVYSSDERDMSNCIDYSEFMENYRFCMEQIHRVTLPGRMTAVHCMDIPSGNCGCDTIEDFPGDIIREHRKCRDPKCKASAWDKDRGRCGHGWFKQIARFHVWKEPLTIRNRTMMKSLSHKCLCNDSSKCSMANADYLLVFRKNGENEIPVAHPNGLLNYAGSTEIPAEILPYRNWQGSQLENRYSQWIWRHYASAFWDDVRLDRVLPYHAAKEQEDEKHCHPLQLDVIERAVVMWSNPGEVVLTPYMGVGSEVYGAICNGRKAIGAELKESYYRQAVRNCISARETYNQETVPLLSSTNEIDL